jgi:phosphoglycerate dehydrogenase-like enzyme
VLITPHVSDTDVAQHRVVEVFSDNLRAYLEGRPLANVIEWARGY